MIVRLGSPDPTGQYADPREAANDGILSKPPDELAAPAALIVPAVQAHHRMRVPLAIALAAMLWILGTILLLTLALAYQLLA